MKKLLLALIILLSLPTYASAQKTKSALTTEINTNLAGGTTPITANLLRTTILDIINSYYDLNGLTTASCGSNTFVTAFPTLSSITCAAPSIANITGLGAGCATWLGTPSSSNLRSCVTDATGTGLAYFQGGDIGTPSIGVGTNLTALNATNLTSGTVPAARLPLTNTSFSVAAATPTALSSGTAAMIGAGVTNCKLTPTYSGRVRVQFDLASSNPGGASFGIVYSLRYGTGTAPANNAAATGTVASGPFTYTSAAGNTTPTTLSAVITGLTPGTAYWFDIAQTSNGSVAVTASYGCNGFEF